MRRSAVSSSAINRALVAVAVLTGICALVTTLAAPPSMDDSLGRVVLRAVLVYPGWLLWPGLPWLGWLLARRGKATDPVLAVLGVVAASVVVQAVNLAVLKVVGWTPAPLPYLGASLAEGLPGLVLLWRAPPLVLQRLAGRTWAMVGVGTALVLAAGVTHLEDGARPMERYWYDQRGNEWQWERSDVRLEPAGAWGEARVLGGGETEARIYHPGEGPLTLHASGSGAVTAVLLLRAEVGASLALQRGGGTVARKIIETHPLEREDEGPVLRYLDAGVVTLVEDLQVAAGDSLEVVVNAEPGYELIDLTSSSPEAVWTLEEANLHLVHYYQILNIAENVEWARQLWTTRFVTLNQPPLWSYFHAGASLLGGPDLPATYLVFVLVMIAIAAVGVRLVDVLEPGAPPWALALPILGALYHLHHVVKHCEANFPDNMFALSVTAACLALARSDAAAFGGAGLASTVLRYPGSAIVTVAALLRGVLWGKPREALRPLAALWAPIAGFCVVMLLAGVVSGQLGDWFFILYFETFPEHFHGEYSLAELLPRAPLFYLELLDYSGYLVLFALPLLGRGSRWLFVLGLGYSLLLCTIDHFTIHYHLPLLALFTAAAGCNVAAIAGRWGKVASGVVGAAAIGVAGVLLPIWW
jgi:hypothetical protein